MEAVQFLNDCLAGLSTGLQVSFKRLKQEPLHFYVFWTSKLIGSHQ